MFGNVARLAVTPILNEVSGDLLTQDETDTLLEKLDSPNGATSVAEDLLEHPCADQLLTRLHKRFGASLLPGLRFVGVQANVLQAWEDRWTQLNLRH